MDMYRIELKDRGERFKDFPRKPYLWKGVQKPFKEDEKTPRISVAPSLRHCLSAWSGNPIPYGFLYRLVSRNVKIIFPKDKVPDCILTKEHWILEPAEFEKVAPFVVHGNLGLKYAHSWEDLKRIIKEILNARQTVEKDGIIHLWDEQSWRHRDLILKALFSEYFLRFRLAELEAKVLCSLFFGEERAEDNGNYH